GDSRSTATRTRPETRPETWPETHCGADSPFGESQGCCGGEPRTRGAVVPAACQSFASIHHTAIPPWMALHVASVALWRLAAYALRHSLREKGPSMSIPLAQGNQACVIAGLEIADSGTRLTAMVSTAPTSRRWHVRLTAPPTPDDAVTQVAALL